MRHTPEATFEAHRLIVHVQVTHGTGRNIQDDLAVAGKTLGDLHCRVFGIDQHVRRAIVIHDPLVKCAHQIGTTGIHQQLLTT
ncbi:hypothetical protein D3C85_1341630 [compost metagenome]